MIAGRAVFFSRFGAGLAFSLCLCQSASATFVDFAFPAASSRDGWIKLNSGNFPRGGFPGANNWTSPIGSNELNSGDADLSRVSGGADGGGPFTAFESLYFGSKFQVPNTLGGTLRISDPTALQTAKTIVFQIQIGEAEGYDFHEPNGTPVLRINGTTVLTPTFTQLLNRYQNGTFYSPATEQDEPVYVNSLGFQWNVSGFGPINSLEIDFSAVTHAQVYRMRLDQTADIVNRNVFLPDFKMVARGIPVYDGAQTSVTHKFSGPANTELAIEYSDSLAGDSWTSVGVWSIGSDGFVDVPFSKAGDYASTFARGMFFRASYIFTE